MCVAAFVRWMGFRLKKVTAEIGASDGKKWRT
jgi:hypothetical protein